jgi:hypothetical protein
LARKKRREHRGRPKNLPHVPSAFPEHDLSLGLFPRPGDIVLNFEPYEVSKPKRIGNLVRVPHFEQSGRSRRFVFNFPFVNEFGIITPHTVMKCHVTAQCFIQMLSDTIYNRLCKRAPDVKNKYKQEALLRRASYLYAITCSDYYITRILGVLRTDCKRLSFVVFKFEQRLAARKEEVYFRSCFHALSRRTRGITPIGGKVTRDSWRATKPVGMGSADLHAASIVVETRLLKLFGSRISPRKSIDGPRRKVLLPSYKDPKH